MENFAAIAANGWFCNHFDLTPPDDSEFSTAAAAATTTTESGATTPGRRILSQRTGDARTADEWRSLNSIMITGPCHSSATSAGVAIASVATVSERAQAALAYRSLLDQMDASPTRVKIRGRVEQQIEEAMEGTWANDLKLKWTERRS